MSRANPCLLYLLHWHQRTPLVRSTLQQLALLLGAVLLANCEDTAAGDPSMGRCVGAPDECIAGSGFCAGPLGCHSDPIYGRCGGARPCDEFDGDYQRCRSQGCEWEGAVPRVDQSPGEGNGAPVKNVGPAFVTDPRPAVSGSSSPGASCVVTIESGSSNAVSGQQSGCVGRRLPVAPDGKVPCVLRETGTAAGGSPCSSRAGRVDAGLAEGGQRRCDINQLSAAEASGDGESAGWYYDESSSAATSECASGARFVFTKGAEPGVGVRLAVECATTADGCKPPKLPAISADTVIGSSCAPQGVLAQEHSTYLDLGTEQCNSGVCLVRQLRGDPSLLCDIEMLAPDCVFEGDLSKHVMCTCRCDGPPGPDLCHCPQRYRCQPLIRQGMPAWQSSYCVPAELLPTDFDR